MKNKSVNVIGSFTAFIVLLSFAPNVELKDGGGTSLHNEGKFKI